MQDEPDDPHDLGDPDLGPAPTVTFASDNAAGALPEVLDALAAANSGHAIAYGDDRWTTAAHDRFRDHFGGDTQTLFCFGGTGANIVALSALVRPWEAVVCAAGAHIDVDETGAAERIVGCKLIDLPTADAKLRPDDLAALDGFRGDVHHVQPGVISITQSTELGTLYTVDEIAALADAAHARGMRVHLDGARIANAAAALGGDVRSFCVDAGVDIVSFGGTKAGMVYGEAVLCWDAELARAAAYCRKQATQLASKHRFIAAQFCALLDDDRWLHAAAHANTMAARLADAVDGLPGLELARPPVVNSLFPTLPIAAIERLQAWSPFYVWDAAHHQVRWMCAWDTTPDDVDRFAAGVRRVLSATT